MTVREALQALSVVATRLRAEVDSMPAGPEKSAEQIDLARIEAQIAQEMAAWQRTAR